MRVTGLEPARISPPDPKSGASANFATPAYTPEHYITLSPTCQHEILYTHTKTKNLLTKAHIIVYT